VSRKLAGELQERWAAYLRFYGEGAIYSALVRLSEIANCLQYADIPSTLVSKWADTLRQVQVTPNDLRSIGEEIKQKVERVRRMLDAGTDLIYEEALLVITVRTELDLLLRYLADRGAAEPTDTSSIDQALDAIAQAPKSSAVFRSAQTTAKRNWGLPLHSKWLSDNTMH
jgi:hypothetical protein